MVEGQRSGGSASSRDSGASTSGSEIPEEYSEAYQRAYRQFVEEHPTATFSPARPGKRASDQTVLGAQRSKVAGLLADLLSDSRGRVWVAVAVVVILLLVAYGAGRLFA